MNAKIAMSVTCVKVTIYLQLYNLHDCTFKFFFADKKICVYQEIAALKNFTSLANHHQYSRSHLVNLLVACKAF